MDQGRQGGCPMCGRMNNEAQDDVAVIRRQIEQLQQRLEALEQEQASPEQMQAQKPQMCPMCQGMMGDSDETPSREELEQQIQEQIQRSKQLLDRLESAAR